MESLSTAVLAAAPADELLRAAIPAQYTAAHLRIEDTKIFDAVADGDDRDVSRSLHVGEVPMPQLAPDEALVAVMASSINYNTVWSATFEPLPTFDFLRRYAREGAFAQRHDQPFHVVGSDAAGVVVRTGAGVTRWRCGDHVIISPVQVDDHEPMTHADSMLGARQRAWGYETNYGGLAQYAVVKASQLLTKPGHLTWEESAVTMLTAATAYRMLIGSKGARIKLGDIVLIWGATGGLGAYAVQLVKNAGGIPVGVVGSRDKEKAARALGCDVVINRHDIGLTGARTTQEAVEQGKRLGSAVREQVGEDPHVAFDYVGKETFGLSVFAVRRGGTVVTCGSSTGYEHLYDNRYLWMNSKRIIGSHGANLQEHAECSRLFSLGKIMPALSAVFPLADVAKAARLVQTNRHTGKVGVLCLAPQEGLGVTDPELRARIGEARLNPLRTV
ncbi:crotonyl-CoA carboxylase/reductase [Streptomyces sp. YC504]|uniref:Crotonyl-CoA carboxylase/reductase n=1 Tax=Streptomyces mesophilus TaxID=1775132 RepID=A0A6G4XBU1_9ACTN|nr:crotonyl-CoA carboxylase/reductase [Streptomyces mesophilus]NGO74111.1 crotonyl-CoA carboxylase/reductase [Streptomyces mesophilus]